ncbi:MAG: hypothetical protein KJ000_28115 [Pirellulaceae bacterium]|nr:hypothetical protein [Pirellulaceae bacterium]
MTTYIKRTAAAAVLCLGLCSCGEDTPSGKATFPVTGQVYVDGQTAAGLQVNLHPLEGFDAADPTVSSAVTEQDGRFAVSTYRAGDGAPEGQYALTFEWKKFDLISKTYSGPDQLNGRCSDPQKSPWRCSVNRGQPTDMGRIELSAK